MNGLLRRNGSTLFDEKMKLNPLFNPELESLRGLAALMVAFGPVWSSLQISSVKNIYSLPLQQIMDSKAIFVKLLLIVFNGKISYSYLIHYVVKYRCKSFLTFNRHPCHTRAGGYPVLHVRYKAGWLDSCLRRNDKIKCPKFFALVLIS